MFTLFQVLTPQKQGIAKVANFPPTQMFELFQVLTPQKQGIAKVANFPSTPMNEILRLGRSPEPQNLIHLLAIADRQSEREKATLKMTLEKIFRKYVR